MESEELYSSLLSSTLQFVRSKIIFQIHLLTNTFSQQHLAFSFLGHLVWEIGYMQFFVACNNLQNKSVKLWKYNNGSSERDVLIWTVYITFNEVKCTIFYFKKQVKIEIRWVCFTQEGNEKYIQDFGQVWHNVHIKCFKIGHLVQKLKEACAHMYTYTH